MPKYKPTILVGKSGSGKDYLLKYMVQKGFTPLVSHTTRPKRANEIDCTDYYFVSVTEFLANNDFIETRSYDTELNGEKHTWYYGLSNRELDRNNDKNIVTIFDIPGANEFIKNTGMDCNIIYLDVSDEIRKNRAILRGSFCDIEWGRRLLDDAKKFSDKELKSIIKHTVINENITIDELYNKVINLLEVKQ